MDMHDAFAVVPGEKRGPFQKRVFRITLSVRCRAVSGASFIVCRNQETQRCRVRVAFPGLIQVFVVVFPMFEDFPKKDCLLRNSRHTVRKICTFRAASVA